MGSALLLLWNEVVGTTEGSGGKSSFLERCDLPLVFSGRIFVTV